MRYNICHHNFKLIEGKGYKCTKSGKFFGWIKFKVRLG